MRFQAAERLNLSCPRGFSGISKMRGERLRGYMRTETAAAVPPVAWFASEHGAECLVCERTVEHRDSRLDSLTTFFINRNCDSARRVSIENALEHVGLAAERIPAVEALAVPPQLRSYFFEGEKLHSKLKPGEVGCYASHLVAMQRIVARNLDYALILEDDAVLPDDFGAILSDVLKTVPAGWDIVHLCRDPSRAVKPVAGLKAGSTLVRYSRIPETTTGYLVSLSGAKKFLKPLKRYWPIDTDFRQPWRFGLEIYGVVPRVVRVHEAFPSSIHALGDHSRSRRGLPRPSRYCWTGNPLHTPHGLYFNIRTLGPASWLACALRNTARKVSGSLGLKRVFAAAR